MLMKQFPTFSLVLVTGHPSTSTSNSLVQLQDPALIAVLRDHRGSVPHQLSTLERKL